MAATPGAFDGHLAHVDGEVTFETLILALFWYAPRHLVHLAILVCALAGCVVLYFMTLAWWQLCWWQSVLLLRTAELMKKAYAVDNDRYGQAYGATSEMKSNAEVNEAFIAPASQRQDVDDRDTTGPLPKGVEGAARNVAAVDDADKAAVAAYELACESWEPDYDVNADHQGSERVQPPQPSSSGPLQEAQSTLRSAKPAPQHQKSPGQLREAQSEEAVMAAAQTAWIQRLRTGDDPAPKRKTSSQLGTAQAQVTNKRLGMPRTSAAGRQRPKTSAVIVKPSTQQQQQPFSAIDSEPSSDEFDDEQRVPPRPLATSSQNDSEADRKARELALLECREFLQGVAKPAHKIQPRSAGPRMSMNRAPDSTMPKTQTPLPKGSDSSTNARPPRAPASMAHVGSWPTCAASPLHEPSSRAKEAARIQALSQVQSPGFIPPHIRAANAAKAARIHIIQAQKNGDGFSGVVPAAPEVLQVEAQEGVAEPSAGDPDTESTTLMKKSADQAIDAEPSLVAHEVVRNSTPPCRSFLDDDAVSDNEKQLDGHVALRAVPQATPVPEHDTVLRFSIDQMKNWSPPKQLGAASCDRCDRLATTLVLVDGSGRQPLCFPCFTVDDRIDDAVDIITKGQDSLAECDVRRPSGRLPKNAVTGPLQRDPDSLQSKPSGSHHKHAASISLVSQAPRSTTPASVEEGTDFEWQAAVSRRCGTKSGRANIESAGSDRIDNGTNAIDAVASTSKILAQVGEPGDDQTTPQSIHRKRHDTSASIPSNRPDSTTSTMSASALPFVSLPRGRESSPMSRFFWVPPAPSSQQDARKLALSPSLQSQAMHSSAPVSMPQPCPQLQRQVPLFDLNPFAPPSIQLPLEPPALPFFGSPPAEELFYHTSSPMHRAPILAPPGFPANPAYGHADFEGLSMHNGQFPSAVHHSDHELHQMYPNPTEGHFVQMPTQQLHRRESSRSTSKAIPIVKPVPTPQGERHPKALGVAEGKVNTKCPEDVTGKVESISDHGEAMVVHRPAQMVTTEVATAELDIGKVTQSPMRQVESHGARDQVSGTTDHEEQELKLMSLDNTAITPLVDFVASASPAAIDALDDTDVPHPTATAASANKLARNRRKADREALTMAWYARESFRVKLNGSYSLDRAQAFATATKEYNAKRKELASSMASGELNEEDANSFPFLSPKDTTAPKVRPKTIAAPATAVTLPNDENLPTANKENESPEPTGSPDSPSNAAPDPALKAALSKTIHAYDTFNKARRFLVDRCTKCNSVFCFATISIKKNPKLHAALEYYRRSRVKLLDVAGGTLPAEIEERLPDVGKGCVQIGKG